MRKFRWGERENGLTTLAEWASTLVLLLAVLLATLAVARATGVRRSDRYSSSFVPVPMRDLLQDALKSAESANAYKAGSAGDPSIHLKPMARIAPVRYGDGVLEIPHYFNDGYVVSVDLSRMAPDQAVRLVDFCSGLLAGASGWLFRAADRVIVLTPCGGVDDAPLGLERWFR
jgi:hypothetical protein